MGKPAILARFLKPRHLIAVVLVAVLVPLSVSGFVWAQKGVNVIEDGKTFYCKTQSDTVADVLDEIGLVVEGGDVVSPALDAEIADGDTIVVRHAIPVTVVIGDDETSVRVIGATVADALVAAGIDPSIGIVVEPSVDAPIESGMRIVAREYFVRIVEEEEEIPFEVMTERDDTLGSGTRKVLTEGTPGRALLVYEAIIVDGVETGRTLKSRSVVAEPIPEVVLIGTKPVKLPSRGELPPPPTDGEELIVVSTAYAPYGGPGISDRTATGAKAGYGIVAVDPKVIPLGTRLYIPGYGYGVAADTGGAIKGNRIDLCFNTVAEALAWGRRTVTVIIVP